MQEERLRVFLGTPAACSDSGAPQSYICPPPDRTGINGPDTGSVDPPEFIDAFRPELVVCFYGEVERSPYGSKVSMPAIPLETDASGSWGCGARWGSWWLQWNWEGPSIEWPISPKELLPILFAVAVWGEHWGGRLVECHYDNMAVVAVVNSGWSQDKTLMHLLRCLFFMAAHFQVHIRATHISGVVNSAADALSRGDLPHFLQVVPEAASQPALIPQQLVDLLVKEQPDWTSPRWAQLFRDCFRQVWPPSHTVCMHQERRNT